MKNEDESLEDWLAANVTLEEMTAIIGKPGGYSLLNHIRKNDVGEYQQRLLEMQHEGGYGHEQEKENPEGDLSLKWDIVEGSRSFFESGT